MNRGTFVAAALLLFGVAGMLPPVCSAANDDAVAAANGAPAASPVATAPTEIAELPAAPEPSFAFQPAVPPASSTRGPQAHPAGSSPWSGFGVGIDVSTLGIGAQIAVPVLSRANVRVGFNWYAFTDSETRSGILYKGKLGLQSVNVNFDYFLFGKFRLSPGLLIDNRNDVEQSATVPGGVTFGVGGTTYESSTASPIFANAEIRQNKVAPEILFGYGNMASRSGRRRWAYEAEIGIAFQGSPKTALGLTGFACTPPNASGPSCVDAATDPTVQASVLAQETKISNQNTILKFYPVATIGISYSF